MLTQRKSLKSKRRNLSITRKGRTKRDLSNPKITICTKKEKERITEESPKRDRESIKSPSRKITIQIKNLSNCPGSEKKKRENRKTEIGTIEENRFRESHQEHRLK